MKSLLTFLIVAAFILGTAKSDTCQCYPDQTVSSTIAAVTIGPPTTTGGFTPPCAPITCNTTVTFNGTLSNGLSAGAQISIVLCSGVANDNNVTLLDNGQFNRIFTSCQSGVYTFSDTNTNIFTFHYELIAPINFTVVLKPIPQIPPTTTSAPAPTTPVYPGPFPYNPAVSRMDLTIGLDANQANQQYIDNIRKVINTIVGYFTYSTDYVRLSFMSFDPYSAVGTGQHPLWSHNATTINATLNNIATFPGSESKFFSTLQTYFFGPLSVDDFKPRVNTERVFIIFAGTDAIFEPQATINDVKNSIDQYDVKFIFVNMDTTKTTQGVTQEQLQAVYPTLSLLSGTNSNKAHWFDYQVQGINAEKILETFYFDGNALCNVPANDNSPVINPRGYSLPTSGTSSSALNSNAFYCNYMNDVRTYLNPNQDPNSVLQVHLNSYDLNTGNDFIRVGVDGTEVGVLTGRYGSAYYCLQGRQVTVTFQSKNGLIYNGYNSTVTQYGTYADCYTNSNPTTFIDVSKQRKLKPIFKL